MAETITIHLNAQAETQGITKFVSALGNAKTAIEGFAGGVQRFVRTAASIAAPLVAAVSGGAMLRGVKTSIDLADSLSKAAQSAGMAAKEFSVLNYAAGLSNVSQEQLITASKGLSEWMTKTGQSGRELSEVLLAQADMFASMEDGSEKMRLATDRFGKSGLGLIPLLNQGSAAIREQMREAEELGLAIGPRFGAMAQQFNDNITRVKSFVQGVFNGVAQAFLPLLVEITERMVSWAKDSAQRIGAFAQDAIGISLQAFREGRFGEFIGLSLEAGIDAGIRKGMQAADATIRAGLEYSFGPGFVPIAATAGKALAHALLVAVKIPVDVLSASFEWLAERAYNLFVGAFNRFGAVLGDILSGSFNVMVEGLNKLRVFGEFAPMQFKVTPEVTIEQRSFADIVAQAQKASAAAIDGTVKYFDERIRETREILTTGQTVDRTQAAPAPNAQERAEAFFQQMRQNMEKRVTSTTDIERTTSERDSINATISRQQLETAKQLFDQQKAAIELEIEKLKTAGLYDEVTGRTIGTLQEEADAIKDQLLALREIAKERMAMNDVAIEHGDPDARLEAQRQEIALAKERLQIERDLLGIRELAGDVGFLERMRDGVRMLGEEFNNVGASIADTLVNGVRSAIRTVSDGIWQVIDGTATWGQLFTQVGRQVISGLIQIAIQELILDNLKRGIAMGWKAFTSAMRGADVAEANATEAAKMPALAANATLASISSWGIAAIIGVAAIAAILATMGSFESGGMVRGGEQVIRVNENGQESVLNAQATAMLGEDMINRLNAGAAGMVDLQGRISGNVAAPTGGEFQRGFAAQEAMVAAQAAPTSGEAAPKMQTFILVDSRQGLMDALASADGETRVIEIVRNNKTQIGIS